jgi:glutathione peroxidase
MLKLFIACSFLLTSIYNIHFSDIDGNDQHFGSYEGKKILIVNIATGSNYVNQLAQLQQLYNQYHDSLEIVVFPSNSFGHESKTNGEIKQFCQNNYSITFKLAAKGNVTGDSMLAIYSWLANQDDNGAMMGTVVGDFQKFLIDKDGTLIGVFAPSVSPLDSTVINAITENY